MFNLVISLVGLLGNNIAYGLGNALASVIGWTITPTALMLGANKMLTPKTKFGSKAGATNALRSRLVNNRSSISPRDLVYGTVRKGGQIAYLEVTGDEGEHLHMVLLHASHECESLGDIYINDEQVPLTSAAEGSLRTPTSGNKYENHLQVYDHLGSENQAVDSALNTISGTIDSNDRFRGICYSYIRLTLDQENNLWPGGLPNITRIVEGKKLYDPRTATKSITGVTVANPPVVTSAGHGYSNGDRVYISGIVGTTELNHREFRVSNKTTDTFELEGIGSTGLSSYTSGGTISKLAYSANAALVIGDFLRSNFGYGRAGTNVSTIATSEWTAAANYSDENVTLSDASTEKRYEINGVIFADEDPRKVANELRKNCAGFVEYIGGKWIIHAGAWRAPSVYLDEGDFAGGISTQTKDDRRSSANRIKGVFANADDNYNLVEFPAVTNATYLANDNDVESYRDCEFKFITSNAAAQRVAKIMLERGRQSITHDATFNLKAMQIQAGDNFMLRFDKYGYGAAGTHTGSDGASTLTDSTLNLTADSLVGLTLENTTDGSSGTITANTTDTITVSLSGGTDNDFDAGDAYRVGKNFVCLTHSLQHQADGAMVVAMSFRESASAVFDWNNGEETTQDSSPNTTLPDPFSISAPATLTLNSSEDHVIRKGNLLISRIKASWTTGNRNVVGYDLQWRKTSESNYTASNAVFVSHPSLCHFITDVEDGVAYNVRVRSVSGVNRSAWTEVTSHTVVGRTTPPAAPTGSGTGSKPLATAIAEGFTVTMDEHPALDFLNFHVWYDTNSSNAPTMQSDGTWSRVANTSTTGTTATVEGLTVGADYYIWVAAMDTGRRFSGSDSEGSTPVQAHPYPVVPLGAEVTQIGISSGNESFNVSTTGITTFGATSSNEYVQIKKQSPAGTAIELYDNTATKIGAIEALNGQQGGLLEMRRGDQTHSASMDGGYGTIYSTNTSGSQVSFAIRNGYGSPTRSFTIDSLGKLEWGTGNIGPLSGDTNLYRYAAGVLGTDDNLQVDGEVRVGDNNNDDLVLKGGAIPGSFTGSHTGSNGASTLTDSTLSLAADGLVGLTLENTTDGSSGTITANTTNTISVSLSGGTDNDFDSGDAYRVSVNVGGSTAAGVVTTKGTGSGSFHVGVEVPANDANDGFYILTDEDTDGTVDTVALKIKANGYAGLRNNAPSARLTIGDGAGTTDHVYHNKSGSGVFPGLSDTTSHGCMIESQGSNGSSIHISRTDNAAGNFSRQGTGDVVVFRNTSGSVTEAGSIEITGATSVAYQTSSDYRLKENVVAISDATARVKELNAVRFNFIGEERILDGFLAHEVQPIVPEAISGTKDGMIDEQYQVSPAVYEERTIEAKDAVYDEEGELLEPAELGQVEQVLVSEAVIGTRSVPKYQGIDQAKLVPLLTAALQEAIDKIDSLESRIADLETKLT